MSLQMAPDKNERKILKTFDIILTNMCNIDILPKPTG